MNTLKTLKVATLVSLPASFLAALPAFAVATPIDISTGTTAMSDLTTAASTMAGSGAAIVGSIIVAGLAGMAWFFIQRHIKARA